MMLVMFVMVFGIYTIKRNRKESKNGTRKRNSALFRIPKPSNLNSDSFLQEQHVVIESTVKSRKNMDVGKLQGQRNESQPWAQQGCNSALGLDNIPEAVHGD